MRWIAALVSAVILALAHHAIRSPRHPGRGSEPLEGFARVIDGDTLDLAGTRIRLLGIDAPELHQSCEVEGRSQPCGLAAREAMAGLLHGPVRCQGHARDRYHRRLAVCRVDGLDIGEAMVRAGQAIDLEGYTAAEAAARAAHRGVWAGTFEEPRQWRREHRPDGWEE